ncbi:MAG: hypothetical protein VX833_03250 [Actinomycetota bacterium]|nr:hypothetical protein [Actinomycetota bacterium]
MSPSAVLPVGEPATPLKGCPPVLVEAGHRIRPTVLAINSTLPVTPVLTGLLPGGLRRGTTVTVSGVGARSLALALISVATVSGSWAAVVGDHDLGLVAALEAGVDLRRLVVVDSPSPTTWGEVVAALVGTLDLVLIASTPRVSGTVARRLATRCRQRGSVLIQVGDDRWPDRCDLRLMVVAGTWSGPQSGRGHLRSRRVEVTAEGRGVMAGKRRAELLLPGPDGAPVAVR